MPDETASLEVEDDRLLVCIHCRKRTAVHRLSGANLCPTCVTQRVRPRYDIERDPEHVERQDQARSHRFAVAQAQQSENQRLQALRRTAEVARIAIAKAAPKPVKSGSELRAEARAQSRAR